MIMKTLLVPLLFSFATACVGQVSGTVKLDHLGMAFTIPSGWVGQQTESGYVLGSHAEPGAILLTSHESREIQQLRAEAMKGISDEGIFLQLTGEIEPFGSNGIAARYAGSLQGQSVKAYGIGLINPHGLGVSILAVTTPDMFTERHVELAREVARGFRFTSPVATPIVNEWKRALTNARLTYMETYSSGSGGYSNKVVIDLCGTGIFTDSRNYNMSIDTGGAFGSDHNSSGGSGSWDVVPDINGNPVLQLNYQDGSVKEYALSYVDEKTLLNGTQYFRTYETGCR